MATTKHDQSGWLFREMRGILALTCTVMTFAYAFVSLALYHGRDVPLWMVGITTSVVAFYFAGHSPSSEQTATMSRTIDTLTQAAAVPPKNGANV